MNARTWSVLGCVICGITCVVLGGEQPWWIGVDGADPPANREIANRIEWTLRQRTDCHFKDKTLEEVINELEESHHIPIWIDKHSLQDEGITTDTPVTLIKSGITFETILRLVLEPLSLTHVTADGVLKVTTQTRADELMSTRIYPVSDLVSPGTQSDDYELLVNVVMTTVSRGWLKFGWGDGTITAFPNARSLIIHQTQQSHRQIEGLLEAIRKAKRVQHLPSIPVHQDDPDDLISIEPARTSKRTRGRHAHDAPTWQRPRIHPAE